MTLLWVEVEVEKELGFVTKSEFLDFGMAEFPRACRARVEKFARVISDQSNRLGMWMGWERSTFTTDDSNIEGAQGFLKKWGDLLCLARDYRVMPRARAAKLRSPSTKAAPSHIKM